MAIQTTLDAIQQLREFCLPEACIRDVTERLLSLVNPTDCHPLLLSNVGSNAPVTRQLRTIKRDYMPLGATLKGFGALVKFSFIIPVRGRGLGRRR